MFVSSQVRLPIQLFWAIGHVGIMKLGSCQAFQCCDASFHHCLRVTFIRLLEQGHGLAFFFFFFFFFF
jgi:hypothetical protein